MTFRDGARLDPSRVQRRGRRRGGGIAIGGGVGGLLLVLAYVLLGGDPADLDTSGGSAGAEDPDTAAAFAERCTTGADANAYDDCRVLGAIESLDAYWSDVLPGLGHAFTPPGVVVFDEATTGGCGAASAATGPYYCPVDATMYLDTSFVDALAAYGFEDGPLAQLYVIAHEYGHHIESITGALQAADRSGTGPDSDGVRIELMADCLAGDWIGEASTVEDPETGRPFLEPITDQQLDNALAAAEAVGDDRIQETVQGYVEPHSFTHGSSQQRREAVILGYEQGAASCDAFGVFTDAA
ncbi:KPN_02809 family neutral zinc metallopeptidase [Demequina activiva]|uniref:Membrane protein n=1 Tax=Demequina activiva TaxID=1582364 RepID=A0A919Q210_9MICO|nr:neutral zinc metallopeptidase [Demequina activiva]GIG54421.1 membrane protein [Demequina activiva]